MNQKLGLLKKKYRTYQGWCLPAKKELLHLHDYICMVKYLGLLDK